MTGSLNFLDFIILAVLFISTLIGFALGFIRSIISVLVWLVAFVVTIFMGPRLTGFFAGVVNDPSIQLWLSYGLVFICAVAAGFIIRMILRLALYTTMIGGTDRLAGALFGFIRGTLIISIFLWFAVLSGADHDSFYINSVLVKFFEPLIAMLQMMFPNVAGFVSSSVHSVGGFASEATGALGGGNNLASAINGSVPGMSSSASSAPGVGGGPSSDGGMVSSTVSAVKNVFEQIVTQVKSVF